MQEFPQYKITPEQGWAQMQPILDKAMPVEHRSRRFVIFWWTSAAVLLVAVISLFLLKRNHQPVDPDQMASPSTEMTNHDDQGSSKNIEPNTGASSGMNEINNVKDESRENSGLSAGNHTENNPAPSPASLSTLASNTESKTRTDHNEKIFSTGVTGNSEIVFHPVEAVENKTNVPVESVPSSRESILSSAQYSGDIHGKERTVSSTEYLPMAYVMLDVPTEDDFIDMTSQITPSTNRRQHGFVPNVSIGGFAGNQNALGANASLGTDYVINSRLSLTANLGYRIYNPDALHFGNLEGDALNAESSDLLSGDLAYAGITNYIVGEKVNASADYNALNPFVKSIHQWQITAGLKYKITKRFFLEGGIGLGFDTNAKSEYPIATFGSIVSVPEANFKSTFDSYDVIRSNMTSLYGGMGYRLAKHLDIMAQWTYGLDHYLLNDQTYILDSTPKRSDYIRGLNVGVRYSL